MSMRCLKEFIVYRDEAFYSSFPSVVVRPDGNLLVAFRRAPERRLRPGGRVTHADPNSQLVLVASEDGGETWETRPRLILAHPAAGCQDPCLTQLADGTLLCTTFLWQLLPAHTPEGPGVRREPNGWPLVNLGVQVVRSLDGGMTWSEPVPIAPLPGCKEHLPGVPNRGACRGRVVELPDGTLLLPVYTARAPDRTSQAMLCVSHDRGESWHYLSTIAQDREVHFHEPHVYRTPSGALVAFLRTAGLEGYLAVCRSEDEGLTFSPWRKTTVWGHPFCTAQTPDGQVLLVYGYRREPFGIRARLLDPECEKVDQAEEIVLRDDGGNSDLGYPWPVCLPNGQMLVVYYFNQNDGTRYIAGTILSL
ncbi:MAG TPA: exo-alpha-sialidase [Armatimonadetes bacterium]|nr:exo-alpha-sialidase [Armatimonadota bacterium]